MRIGEERGLVLINFIVAVALTAIIAVGAGMTTVQVLGVTQQNQDINKAVRNAQNAGFIMSEDLLMAESVTSGDDVGTTDVEFLTIFARDWESGYTYESRYIWRNPADQEKDVIKKQKVCDENGIVISNTNSLIAKNLSAVTVTEVTNLTQLNIQAQSQNKNVTRKYYVNKRLELRHE